MTVDSLRIVESEAQRYLGDLKTGHVASSASFEELRDKLDLSLPQASSDPSSVINQLISATQGGLIGSATGRFFAWVIGGATESALAADWLTTTWDQNAALYSCSPAAAIVEEVAGRWLLELLDLPRDASFAFTTGCQLAHFTCLAAARHFVLSRVGYDVNQRGLFQAPAIDVIAGDQRHTSVDRALRYLGFGDQHVTSISTDDKGVIDENEFSKQLLANKHPKIVVLGAADINTGVFDDFQKLIPLARKHNAWVHIDGAFGLFARACHSKSELLEGVELADSWATDGHKWLNVPFDSGYAFIRDAKAHKASMTIGGSYITAAKEARDQIDWNPEWSRRARGFSTYAAILELGRDGIDDLISRSCRHAETLVAELGKLPNTEVLWHPQLNQGLVRFLDPRKEAGDIEHGKRTDAVIEKTNEIGEAFFSGTTWRGVRAMRISVVNWRTCEKDVKRAVESVAKALDCFTSKGE